MTVTCAACRRTFDVEGECRPGDPVDCRHCGTRNALAEPGGRSAPAEAEGDLVAVGTMLGPYRIEGLLGKGGMGAVYRGLHTLLQRAVAIKVLPRALARDAEFVERFKREAQALANLSHPNIVAVHDMGIHGDTYYFAMELVEGESMRDLMNRGEAPPARALGWMPALCDALEYAHARGVIHRDIKPENIIIERGGRPKIADFGLAKIVRGEASTTTPTLTLTSVVMGTPDYMAPEQRDSMKKVDHRADIFSLGVVLYEALTGDVPLGTFEPPSLRSGLDPRIDGIVARALESNPDRRYQKATQLGRDVGALLEAVPAAEAAAGSLGSTLQGLRDRIPRLHALPFVFLGTLTGGVFSVLYLYRVIRWLRDVLAALRALGHRVARAKRDDWNEIDRAAPPRYRYYWFGAIATCGGLGLVSALLLPPPLAAATLVFAAYLFLLTLHFLYIVFEHSVGRSVCEIIDRVECLAGGKSEWAMLRYRLSWTSARVLLHGLVIAVALLPVTFGTVTLVFYPIGLCVFWNARVGIVRKILRSGLASLGDAPVETPADGGARREAASS